MNLGNLKEGEMNNEALLHFIMSIQLFCKTNCYKKKADPL